MFVELSIRPEGYYIDRKLDSANWNETLRQLWMMQTRAVLGGLPNFCVVTLVARFAPEKKVFSAADWHYIR